MTLGAVVKTGTSLHFGPTQNIGFDVPARSHPGNVSELSVLSAPASLVPMSNVNLAATQFVASEPLTAKVGALSAGHGFADRVTTLAPEIYAHVVNRVFSLPDSLGAGYYEIANRISGGAVQDVALSEDAPEHVLEAQRASARLKQHAGEAAQGLMHAWVQNFNPIGSMAGLVQTKVKSVVNGIRPELERAKVAWNRLSEQVSKLKQNPTHEDLYQLGGVSADVAASALLVGLGIILPNGKKVGGRYEVEGETWPKKGGYLTAYRDGDVIFKHPNSVLVNEVNGKTVKVPLTVAEQIRYKNTVVELQNALGSPLPEDVYPRLVGLEGIWMRQQHRPGKVPAQGALSATEEKRFSADRERYAHLTMEYAQQNYAGSFGFTPDHRRFEYFTKNTYVTSDWDRVNLRFHEGKTSWFDLAEFWPIEVLQKAKLK